MTKASGTLIISRQLNASLDLNMVHKMGLKNTKTWGYSSMVVAMEVGHRH